MESVVQLAATNTWIRRKTTQASGSGVPCLSYNSGLHAPEVRGSCLAGLDAAFCRKEPASFWAASCRVLRPIRTGSVEVATKTCLAREVLRA